MSSELVVGLAVFLGVGGLAACLAGLAGLAEIRRLRRVGVTAAALVRYHALGPEDRSAAVRPLLQFATESEQVVEVFSPVPSSRALPLVDGGRVQVRYDPSDPRQVLLDGRERTWLEHAFVNAGAAVMLAAVALVAVGA